MAGTIAILVSCGVGYMLSLQEGTPSHIARNVAFSVLAGVLISFLMDWRYGLRNLLRVDVFALLAYFFLTFFEFLFPQTRFDFLVIPEDVVEAIHLLLIGMVAIVIGRHLKLFPRRPLEVVSEVRMQPRDFLVIFFGAAFFNFLPLFLSVDFNPVAWFEETLKPRFGRAWARSQYGTFSTLLKELQLLGYILPPIGGLIFARFRQYNKVQLAGVGIVLVLLWYTAFSSGTRNILAIQLAGFFAGYFIIQREIRLKIAIPAVILVGGCFVVIAEHMVSFRNMGLGPYVEHGLYKAEYKEFEAEYLAGGIEEEGGERGYFVDYNLWRLSQLVPAFPELHGFIGWNMPFVAITKPVPRALWPSKPMDLAVSLEDVVGATGYTVAVTWVGEAFIAGGPVWIIATGLLIGAFCALWNHLARFVHSPFALIVFASGFYAVLLLMRSLMFFTTALLPSVALIVMGVLIQKNRKPIEEPAWGSSPPESA